MLKELIIKILFRLLEEPNYGETQNEDIVKWLDSLYPDPRFKGYYKKRSLSILRTMGVGLSEKEYWITIGQRLELNILLNEASKAHEVSEKKRIELSNKK